MSFLSRLGDWKTTPISRRTAPASATVSWPRMRARPPVGRMSVERIRKSVVFPPPFGPRRPKISPGSTANDTPSSARAVAVLVDEGFRFDRAHANTLEREDPTEERLERHEMVDRPRRAARGAPAEHDHGAEEVDDPGPRQHVEQRAVAADAEPGVRAVGRAQRERGEEDRRGEGEEGGDRGHARAAEDRAEDPGHGGRESEIRPPVPPRIRPRLCRMAHVPVDVQERAEEEAVHGEQERGAEGAVLGAHGSRSRNMRARSAGR